MKDALPPDLPRELRIGYRVVKVRAFTVEEVEEERLAGRALISKGEILLDIDQPPVEMANTVLHECLHHLWYQGSLNEGEHCEERAVHNLTNSLCALIQNNPALVVYLLRALDSEINPDGVGRIHQPPKRSRRRARA